MEKKIKVLVVDDAAFMRKAVIEILNFDPDIEVVGTAENGLIALGKIPILKPDVITLDMDMPVMNGIVTIQHIMIKCQIPIIALSSLSTDGAVTFEALRLGVVDFIPKPSGAVSRDIITSKQMIIDRVKLAATVKVENIHRARLPRLEENHKSQDQPLHSCPDYIVAVGTNLCGPNTVIRLMTTLPASLPAAVVVVQEIAPQILPAFVRRFNDYVPWKIKALQEDTILESGVCYIASNTTSIRLTVNPDGSPRIAVGKVVDNPIDMLFTSAAEVFQQHAVGVLLSGVGEDGAQGLARIKQQEGNTLVKDTHCCIFPNLTENAIAYGVAGEIIQDRNLSAGIQSVIATGVEKNSCE